VPKAKAPKAPRARHHSKDTRQISVFDSLPCREFPDWRPQEPPDLSGETELIVDYETTGLRWWGGDVPVGLAVGTRDGRTWYLPTRHAGGNLDEETVKRFARTELKGKHIIGFHTGFDIHMSRVFGADLEELGCTVSDVSHYVALIDDHRKEFSLEDVSQKYLGEGKVKGIDTKQMARYHAAEAASYARKDVVLTNRLRDTIWPLLDKENLQRVRALEDRSIFVTCEMEKNGAPIDEEKLDRWIAKSERDYIRLQYDLCRVSGLRIDPRKPADVRRLFDKLDIDIPIIDFGPDQGKQTFNDVYLRPIKNESIQILRRARKLASLRSKYFLKYKAELNRNGILRYSLNQLRGEEGGTVSGRYSSSAYSTNPPEGVNIQQVAGKKQMASMKEMDEEDDPVLQYNTRELFITGDERSSWLSADASQIEYRLFANLARPPSVMKAYDEDRWTDYHEIVRSMILPIVEITRVRTKDLNFAKLYGAGLRKIAWMLGLQVQEILPFVRAYDHAFPEARRILRSAMELAAPECPYPPCECKNKHRGWVKTITGRRARFPYAIDLHSALNRVIQGTAADVNKQKLIELHDARKWTGLKLRFTVHDEGDGDIPNLEAARRVQTILNRQSFPEIRPDILWKVSVGENWGKLTDLEKAA
jgi:Mesyanzhinovviridae DNA polymerase